MTEPTEAEVQEALKQASGSFGRRLGMTEPFDGDINCECAELTDLRSEVKALREQMKAMKDRYEERLREAGE